MSVQEREYMKRDEESLPPSIGVEAKNQEDADRILKWACTTQDAEGKWHRVTLALSRVPIMELYNVLSNANFIAQRLRELAKRVDSEPLHPDEIRKQVERAAANIDRLRALVSERERPGSGPIVVDPTIHIHGPK